jgi:hypothetical protein
MIRGLRDFFGDSPMTKTLPQKRARGSAARLSPSHSP